MSPPRRLPLALWREMRLRIWERDGRACVRCKERVRLRAMHVDHIIPLYRGGTNADGNLRTLCRRCHVLRADPGHRGMIADALRRGIIPPNWRELVWDDAPQPKR